MTGRRLKQIAGWLGILIWVLCLSAAGAEENQTAEENLAAHGFSAEEIILQQIRFIPDGTEIRFPITENPRPLYLWFDVTGDGCVDFCSTRMFGSGMVRTEMTVYDPVLQKKYILDGYNYNFLPDSVTEDRLVVIKNGPHGYGEPIFDVRGTVILVDDLLLFVADPEEAEGFDPARAAVSAEQAARIAYVHVRNYMEGKFCSDAAVAPGECGGKLCWVVSLIDVGLPRYTVHVNMETGEVENAVDVRAAAE
ncbi:MAG: hypothetical protein IJQ71_04235 [Clostridia bacterium]|nr:hypothetical protein [Clostridia bacterium]